MGKFVTESLIKGGKHRITALTRAGSSNSVPAGVQLRTINYDDEATIVDALRGQDALIITMGVTAPPEQQTKLINAAAAADVPWVLPNEYGYALNNEGAGKDCGLGTQTQTYRDQIEAAGRSSWIGITCGFWYDLSLAAGGFGFDIKNQTAVFIDEGKTKIDTSTLAQSGRAVASLLALPTLPQDENDKSPNLNQFRNNFVYFNSFKLSQDEMFQSILRVTGTKSDDWKKSHEDHGRRFLAGTKAMQEGDRAGFVKVLYTRMFYPDGVGDLEKRGRLANGALSLPNEDLDEETKKALAMETNY